MGVILLYISSLIIISEGYLVFLKAIGQIWNTNVLPNSQALLLLSHS